MTRVGWQPRSTRRGAMRWLPAAAILVLAIAACSPAATATPTSATPSPVASPSVAPSATGTPPATAAPTPTLAPASPSPTPTATSEVVPPPFACTDLPYVRRSGSLSVRVADVRVGQHPGYDRIVYEFGAGKLPAIDIRVAKPPFKLDPSDLPVTIDGASFIRIKLTHVAVETVPSAADDLKPGLPLLVELRQIAGYEGDATWIAGFSGPVCVRVSTLRAPARLVIDVQYEAP